MLNFCLARLNNISFIGTVVRRHCTFGSVVLRHLYCPSNVQFISTVVFIDTVLFEFCVYLSNQSEDKYCFSRMRVVDISICWILCILILTSLQNPGPSIKRQLVHAYMFLYNLYNAYLKYSAGLNCSDKTTITYDLKRVFQFGENKIKLIEGRPIALSFSRIEMMFFNLRNLRLKCKFECKSKFKQDCSYVRARP